MKKLKSFIPLFLFIFTSNFSQVNHVVISQIYGGGGNSNAAFANDFVELFNPTGSTVSLSGWSLKYASSTGMFWSSVSLTGSIGPGKYYLIKFSGGSNGAQLPAADAVKTSINISAANGKLVLFSSSASNTGLCPTTNVVDKVGYGSANCYEGAACNSGNNTTALVRLNSGCKDSNNNASDFGGSIPNPRNSSSPANYCYPVRFAITSISPTSPIVGESFSITIAAHNAGGTTTAVTSNTSFILASNSAAGPLSGTTTGTIPAGSSSVTLTNVRFSNIGNNAAITVNRTSGDNLSAATSGPFNVVCGSITAAHSGTSCAGDPVTLTAASGNSRYAYTWTPSNLTGSSVVVNPAASQTYTVTGSDPVYSCSNTAVVTVSVNPLPAVTAAASDNEICIGESVSLTAGGANNYSWNNGSAGSVITVTPSSTTAYTVTGTDGNGCANTASLSVIVNAYPTVTASANPSTVITGNSTTLTASGASAFTWMPGTLNGNPVSVSPTINTTYTVTGTDNGCSSTATVEVIVTAGGPTKLQNAYCGITLTALDQNLYCDPVSNASQYRYEVTAPDNSVYTYVRNNSQTIFRMSWITAAGYSKTYSVKAAAYVNGAWTLYGQSCNVTTPPPPTTNLSAGSCGITQTTLDEQLYCDQVTGAANYRYEITYPDNSVYVYTRGNGLTNFLMTWIPNVGYNKTYSIKASAYVGGEWLAYGSSCTVATPPHPLTKLNTASCGVTETSLAQTLNCISVPGAVNYRYEITYPDNSVYVYTRGNALTSFLMTWVPGAAYNTTYSIRVAAYADGVWFAYGDACTVTTPSMPLTQLQTAYCGITETSLNQILYCDQVSGASNYRYEITDASSGNVYVYTRGNGLTSFVMGWAAGVTYGKTYSVKVASYTGGEWSAYGNACDVTTPANSSGRLMNPDLDNAEEAETEKTIAPAVYANVFPNPSSGTFTLELNAAADVVITNMLGQTVFSEHLNEGSTAIDLQHIESGIYNVNVLCKEGSKQIRLIRN